MPAGALHGLPFSRKLAVTHAEISQHPIERRLHEGADFPLPVHHDSQHTSHDAPHGNHGLVSLQIVFHRPAVLQSKRPGEINPHKIVFLRTKICGIAEMIILLQILGLPDTPQNLLLRLGIDPHPQALLILDVGHLLHQPIYVFSLPSGVRTHIDGAYILAVHQRAYNSILLLGAVNDLIFKFFRQERNRVKAPASVFLIINLRIAHGYKMPHAPSDNRVVCLQIPVS